MNKKLLITAISFSLLFTLFSCESSKQEPASDKGKQEVAKSTESDAEYKRSIGEISVSKSTFEMDKKEISKKVSELNVIMREANYQRWLSYIDDESIKYWSSQKNLSMASQKLPKSLKGFKLRSLEEYFKFVFIPSRTGRNIDEIRYINENSINAVQIKEDGSPIIYYTFIKVNGRWLVELPRN